MDAGERFLGLADEGVATGIVTAAYTFPKIVEALSGMRGWRERPLAKLKR